MKSSGQTRSNAKSGGQSRGLLSMTGLRHPLPPNFFVCPQTTPQEESEWIQTGLRALTALVRDTQVVGGPMDWTLDTDTNGLQIYWGSDIGNSDLTLFMSVAEIEGSLDEAAELHIADTPEAYHAYIARYNKDIIDCAVLKTLAPPTDDHPHNYIGLKWLTLETPVAIRNRDFTFVECRDEFSINGVRGWARVMHSVELPWVPDLRDAMGIVRASYENSGVVFQEIPDKPGFLRVSQLWNTNLRGFIPTWIQRIGIKRRARSVLAYDAFFRAMRLANEPLLDMHEMVPPSSRRKCFLCQHVFNPLSKRQNCRRCGEVVCRHCNKKWEITDARQVTRYVRVCFRCSSGPPVGNSLDDSEDEASVVHHDGLPRQISDARSEPARQPAKSSIHLKQGRGHRRDDFDQPLARHPHAHPPPPHQLQHQESYPPQYPLHANQHHHPHYNQQMRAPAVHTPAQQHHQPHHDRTPSYTSTKMMKNAPTPQPRVKEPAQPTQNPWDELPSMRDLPPYPHHQPMYHKNINQQPHHHAAADEGSTVGLARPDRPHELPRRRHQTPQPPTAHAYPQQPQRYPTRGSADDNATVSKAQLVDLYRQLKHSKIDSGASTPLSYAA